AESWRHTLRGLAGRTTVYALDLPGFGASAKPRARYRLPYFAGALHGFMEALGIQGASLVGHSLGAAVAVTYAVTHPARVERLALVGGLVPGFGYRPWWVCRLVALPLVRGALGALVAEGFAHATVRWVDECGHFPQIEQAETVNRWLVDFLVGRPAPR